MAAKAGPGLSEYRTKARYVRNGFLASASTLALKLTAAILSNSLTIFTDLLHNIGETLACFFAWLTMRRIAKGTAVAYEYGYGKAESLSSLLVAGVMVLSLVIALAGAVERFRHPVDTHRVELGFFVAVYATGLNTILWHRKRRITRSDASPIIESQWHLFRSKAMANGCVVGGLGLDQWFEGAPWAIYIDPAASLVVCGFLAHSIYNVWSKNAADLLDRALDESLQLVILRALASHFDDYVAFHGLRSRHSGKTVYIELFLEFEGSKTMAEVQKTIASLQSELERHIPGSRIVIAPATAKAV
ncbi:MAG: cation diffusion facilitator family transporter [Nitrospirota bacterium]|nr:cation diffusion facilitator family transporter [Nitrospirota bacterium]MDE3035525.1 cation diffusion facilitator family transporter [Nitrospirota bacterium]MDE3241622.1 cation diffusion facilitator family transporter [Nitrospirota bacterium]